MAERPVFIPAPDTEELVKELFLPLTWHSGFALVQKEKKYRRASRGSGPPGPFAAPGDFEQVKERARSAYERVPYDGADQEL